MEVLSRVVVLHFKSLLRRHAEAQGVEELNHRVHGVSVMLDTDEAEEALLMIHEDVRQLTEIQSSLLSTCLGLGVEVCHLGQSQQLDGHVDVLVDGQVVEHVA